MKWIGTSLLLVSIAIACNSREQLICGKWQAYQTLENHMPLQIDHSEITFVFDAHGLYQYTGSNGYREMGTFSIRDNTLYTLDTLNKASSEKALEIVKLTPDSLFLGMTVEGNPRILKLYKVKQ